MSGIQPLDVALRGRPLDEARSRAATWQLLFIQRRQQDQSHLRPGPSTCRSTPPTHWGVNRFRLRSTALPGRSTTSLRVGASPRRTTAPVGHESATAAPLRQHSWLTNSRGGSVRRRRGRSCPRLLRTSSHADEVKAERSPPLAARAKRSCCCRRDHTRHFVAAGGDLRRDQ